MTEQSKWKTFFDAHASVYMQNCFTTNTEKEVEFLIEELDLKSGSSILDMGCGTGRHSVRLAQRGFRMTGIDQSAGMLAEASKTAAEMKVTVEWIQADARQFARENSFDAAICLCEGSFGLLETAGEAIDQPLNVLRSVCRSLKPGGKCLFTVLSAYRMIRSCSQADVESGTFDPLTLSQTLETQPRSDAPAMKTLERGFVPTELRMLFELAGLTPLHIWGGTAGSWNKATINLDEYEIMVIARKA